MMFAKYMAGQLARPHGIFGRLFMGRQLNQLNETMNDLTFEVLQPVQGRRILEIGFGGGDLIMRLLHAGARVSGADVSDAMVVRLNAQIRAMKRYPNVDVRTADACHLPFEDNSFDKVCSVNTLYFWSDASQVLREIRRVLSPGGEVAICFNLPEELRKWEGHRHGFALYTIDEVGALLHEAGFVSVSSVIREDAAQGRFVCVTAH